MYISIQRRHRWGTHSTIQASSFFGTQAGGYFRISHSRPAPKARVESRGELQKFFDCYCVHLAIVGLDFLPDPTEPSLACFTFG